MSPIIRTYRLEDLVMPDVSTIILFLLGSFLLVRVPDFPENLKKEGKLRITKNKSYLLCSEKIFVL